jgi:hypothetical protein
MRTLIMCSAVIVVLLLPARAQDIESKLSGSTSSQGFTILTPTASPLFSVRGNGRVGVGTLAPDVPLHVLGAAKIDAGTAALPALQILGNGGFVVSGTFGTGTIPATGTGTRMMFHSRKAAFRAGYASTQWEEAEIGSHSFAAGYMPRASGNYTISLGYGTVASGTHSVAIGDYATASGGYAVALGQLTTASGLRATALGHQTTASGEGAVSMGIGTAATGRGSLAVGTSVTAEAYAAVALGRYNVGGGSPTAWVSTDPLFEIGIGAGPSMRENALTVLKNGYVGIGTSSPISPLDVRETGTSHALYVRLDNTTSTSNCVRAITSSSSIDSDALEAWASAGSAVHAGASGARPAIWTYNSNASLSAKIISAGSSGSTTSEVFSVLRNGNLTIIGQAYKPGGGSWASSSDLRLKHLDGAYERGLDEILLLRPVRFHYREGNLRNLPTETSEIGFVAQEVRAVMPECVTEGDDGYLDFNMHPVNVALVNAVQQLAREKNAEIATLRGELDALREELRVLKQIVAGATRGSNPDASQAALEVR